jgi:hypothetical protein
MKIAQTNLQLYNQLRLQGRTIDELVIISRAYELLTVLYSGYYQADGKPFVAHGVGVASTVAHLGMSAEFVAAGLLHNIYGNADFGDGLNQLVTDRRRRMVCEAVGERVEDLLVRFRKLRITPKTIRDITLRLDQLDSTDRNLVLMDLADYLEKYIDLGVLYYGENSWLVDVVDKYGSKLIEIAKLLGEPKLATMLSKAFAQADASKAEIPDVLRTPNGRQYMELVIPLSCRRRLSPVLRKWHRLAWQRLYQKI